MSRLSFLILLALAPAVSADTSSRRTHVDVSRFAEVAGYHPGRRVWMIAPGGRTFITRGGGGVTVYEAATGRELGVLKGHSEKLHDAGWSLNGRFLATCGYDGDIRVWDLSTLRQTAVVQAHEGFS